MDELEISGKRYISTRRAAKEHKYHSDYIGQLIRAGKVEGQKVGRSWYVVADSLSEYLGKETPDRAFIHTPENFEPEAEEPVIEKKELPIHVVEVPQKLALEPELEIEEIVEEKKPEAEERHIPLKIQQPISIKREAPVARAAYSTLRYVSDDAPLYPRMEQHGALHVMPRRETVIEETVAFKVEEIPVEVMEKPKRVKKNFKTALLRAASVLVIGVMITALAAAVSVFFVSTTTLKGETASVGYSFSMPSK